MTDGMAEVMAQLDGVARRGLPNLEATLQYCYYVAGTVGVMLTGLFIDGFADVRPSGTALRPRAPAFGRALQLTNILKDIREDLDRGFCWLPRTLMADHGLSTETLTEPGRREQAVALLDEMIAVARAECDVAFEYSLLIPSTEPGLRLFCLWPLFFALRTLAVLFHNPAVFEPAPVKIDRETVMRIMVVTRESVTDDAALRNLFEECARGLPRTTGMRAEEAVAGAGPIQRGLRFSLRRRTPTVRGRGTTAGRSSWSRSTSPDCRSWGASRSRRCARGSSPISATTRTPTEDGARRRVAQPRLHQRPELRGPAAPGCAASDPGLQRAGPGSSRGGPLGAARGESSSSPSWASTTTRGWSGSARAVAVARVVPLHRRSCGATAGWSTSR
jgi:hypothetical protein